VSEDVASESDDVGFVLAILDLVAESVRFDPDRVFVTGASNGGMMTFRLALEANDRFTAAAAVIANLPDPSECRPLADPIPMLIMNGTDDPLMPYEGGYVAGSACERGRVMSTRETVDLWVAINHADPEFIIEAMPNSSWYDRSRVVVYTYLAGADGADVVYYEVAGGGHADPGRERLPAAIQAVTEGKNRDIDGPTEIWAFFARFLCAP